jgi:endo-1,4-beta-xylanase
MLSRRAILSTAGALAAAGPARGALRGGAAARVPFGACVRPGPLADEFAYRAALREHCQQITPEGDLIWATLRPARNQFKFEIADQIVTFAQANAMTLRGHTLAWYGAMPDWTKEIANAREAERELTTHIERVVSRYRGKIKTWHVVNEPIDDVKSGVPALRPTVWLQHLGARYIDIALRAARAADPAAELLINEYDIEYGDGAAPRKRQALQKLLREVRERGAPLDGVGLQGHLRGELQIDRDGLFGFASELRSLALSVHVTELDVIDDKLPGPPEMRDLMVGARMIFLNRCSPPGARPRSIAGALATATPGCRCTSSARTVSPTGRCRSIRITGRSRCGK